MSEISESYHLLGRRQLDAVKLLKRASVDGYVFPADGKWVTFLADGELSVGSAAVYAANRETLLYLWLAEDHGWGFRLFSGAECVASYQHDWEQPPQLLDDEQPSKVVGQCFPDGCDAQVVEELRSICSSDALSNVDPEKSPAYRFAKLLNIANFSWLSFESFWREMGTATSSFEGLQYVKGAKKRKKKRQFGDPILDAMWSMGGESREYLERVFESMKHAVRAEAERKRQEREADRIRGGDCDNELMGRWKWILQEAGGAKWPAADKIVEVWNISPTQIEVECADGSKRLQWYRVRTDITPKHIDYGYTQLETPFPEFADSKEKEIAIEHHGVYEICNEVLRICFGVGRDPSRPRDFTTLDGTCCVHTYQRITASTTDIGGQTDDAHGTESRN